MRVRSTSVSQLGLDKFFWTAEEHWIDAEGYSWKRIKHGMEITQELANAAALVAKGTMEKEDEARGT